MSLKQVRKKMETLLEGYNKLYDRELKFDQVFSEPRVANKDDIKMLREWFKHDEDDKKERKDKQDILGLMLGSHLPEYKPVKGKILIYSAEDNSIPYELFELMENYFGAVRVHLG